MIHQHLQRGMAGGLPECAVTISDTDMISKLVSQQVKIPIGLEILGFTRQDEFARGLPSNVKKPERSPGLARPQPTSRHATVWGLPFPDPITPCSDTNADWDIVVSVLGHASERHLRASIRNKNRSSTSSLLVVTCFIPTSVHVGNVNMYPVCWSFAISL